MPAPFRADTHVPAVVSDLIDAICARRPDPGLLAAFRGLPVGRQRWVLAGCHLLWHPAFRTGTRALDGVSLFLVESLAALAAVADANTLLIEEERREELIRLALRVLVEQLPGEDAQSAEDRFRQVDSVERHRVTRAAATREARARAVREAMAKKAAEEAAAKVSRE